MRFSQTTKYQGLSSIYFNSIIEQIIIIGDLNNKNFILDYGCGEKKIQKKLNKEIYNYDINPLYSEIEKNNLKNLKIETIILSHVLMYMTIKEIKELFNQFYQLNNNMNFVVALGKQNLFSNILKYLTFNKDAHKGTLTSYEDQMSYIYNEFNINKVKNNIFFMTDVISFSFKNNKQEIN